MNNSKLAIDFVSLSLDEKVDITPTLIEEEGKLIKIIEAIREVQKSKHWSTLKTELFDGLTETLSSELTREAKKDNPDQLRLRNIAGQLKWAEGYSDLKKLEESFRQKLTNVRIKLNGTTQERPGRNPRDGARNGS